MQAQSTNKPGAPASISRSGEGGLEAIETASRDEIAALQLSRMKETLQNAYANSPFYRAHFDKHGIHPDDLHGLEDLARFPFTVKQDLRDNYPFSMFSVPKERLARVHASSGTTGKPTVVGYTLKDIDTWAQVVARSIYASGAGRARWCTLPTDTAFSPAVSVRTTAPRSSAAPSCRFPAG